MLINRHQTVSLSFISTDLPVWDVIETTASIYQKDKDRFHLLMDRQNLPNSYTGTKQKGDKPYGILKDTVTEENHARASHMASLRGLFWLEISPYRVTMTMQSNGRLSYRHYWERGIYGVSRYCLNSTIEQSPKSLYFRNFTRHLELDSDPLPKSLRIEYEIWSADTSLGSYILHLNVT